MAAVEQKNVKSIAPANVTSLLGLTTSGKMGSVALWCDVVAPRATGFAMADTVALQAAIDATPANGWLHIPRGAYQINAKLSITKNIKITGSGVSELVPNILLPDVPLLAPYLSGTTITQNAAGEDAIFVNGRHIVTNFADFGILFGDAIRFLNTGHGINAEPTIASGQTYHNVGLVYSTWKNISVFGHDGNHYGFRTLNPMVNTWENLRAWGGGVMSLECDTPIANCGNMVIIHPYGILMVAGSAHAYQLSGDPKNQSMGFLNLITFIRPQVNVENLEANFPITKPTSAQKLWETLNPGRVTNVLLISPDLENGMSGVVLPSTFSVNTTVIAGGGFFTNTGSPAYIEQKPYNPQNAPTFALLGGAGGGASAAFGARPTDKSGTLQLTTGTGTPNGNLATITYAREMLQQPKFVMVTMTRGAVAQQFIVAANNTTGFTIAAPAGQNPAPSTLYHISWQVVE